METIYLASDHGGFAVKDMVKDLLSRLNVPVKDMGPSRLTPDDDYPDYIFPLAEQVVGRNGRGIIACRNGQGAAIAANKVAGVRAAVCFDEQCAVTSRTDDDSNILSLPADYLAPEQVEQIVVAWLKTPFSADARHLRRLKKIKYYEQQNQPTNEVRN